MQNLKKVDAATDAADSRDRAASAKHRAGCLGSTIFLVAVPLAIGIAAVWYV